MPFCIQCGREVPVDHPLCPNCGAVLAPEARLLSASRITLTYTGLAIVVLALLVGLSPGLRSSAAPVVFYRQGDALYSYHCVSEESTELWRAEGLKFAYPSPDGRVVALRCSAPSDGGVSSGGERGDELVFVDASGEVLARHDSGGRLTDFEWLPSGRRGVGCIAIAPDGGRIQRVELLIFPAVADTDPTPIREIVCDGAAMRLCPAGTQVATAVRRGDETSLDVSGVNKGAPTVRVSSDLVAPDIGVFGWVSRAELWYLQDKGDDGEPDLCSYLVPQRKHNVLFSASDVAEGRLVASRRSSRIALIAGEYCPTGDAESTFELSEDVREVYLSLETPSTHPVCVMTRGDQVALSAVADDRRSVIVKSSSGEGPGQTLTVPSESSARFIRIALPRGATHARGSIWVLSACGSEDAQGGLHVPIAEPTVTRGQTVEGRLPGNSEYHLLGIGGEPITVSVTSSDFDTVLTIRKDGLGRQIATDDDGGPGSNSLASLVLPADGTYTVEVRAFRTPLSGAFKLLVDGAGVAACPDDPSGPYSLRVRKAGLWLGAVSSSQPALLGPGLELVIPWLEGLAAPVWDPKGSTCALWVAGSYTPDGSRTAYLAFLSPSGAVVKRPLPELDSLAPRHVQWDRSGSFVALTGWAGERAELWVLAVGDEAEPQRVVADTDLSCEWEQAVALANMDSTAMRPF